MDREEQKLKYFEEIVQNEPALMQLYSYRSENTAKTVLFI